MVRMISNFYVIFRTKYTFYRAIINISGFGHVWSTIPKFSPVVQEKIEKI